MKSKNTKRALLASILSIMLCMAMLIGSTFAWFTDNVTSGKNKIVAGNLDIELNYKNVKMAADGENFAEVLPTTENLFVNSEGNDIRWEPGAAAVTYLELKNAGNLALKYQLSVDAKDTVVGSDGAALSKVLKTAVVEITEAEVGTYDRATAVQKAKAVDAERILGYKKPGEMTEQGQVEYLAMIVYFPEEIGNTYEGAVYNRADVELKIELSLNLVATQMPHENDSFGKDYDANTAWLGEADTTWYSESANTFTIDTPDKFAGLAKLVNDKTDFTGKNITLNCDVDLADIDWTPIGSKEDKIYFTGVFDGNNKTISGLNIASGDYVSLFGAIKDATIKNLTVKGSVNGENGAGIVARMESGTVENCKSYVTVESAGKSGGIVCLTNNGGCTISGCENYGAVNGADAGTVGGVGGIVAYANPNTIISDCKNFGDIGSAVDTRSGGIVGYGSKTGSSIINCVNSGKIIASQNAGGIVGITTEAWNITACTNNGVVSSAIYAGGIVGSVQNGKVESCKNTASVDGKTAGGVVGVTGGAPEIILCSGGTAQISTPAQKLGFNGHPLVLDLAENACAGRLIGANGGGDQNAWVKLTIDDSNGDDTSICAVGLCGLYTTWANLEVVSGTFYGDPAAGNMTYIKIDEGSVWADREPGIYSCGGVTEATRKTEWTKN